MDKSPIIRTFSRNKNPCKKIQNYKKVSYVAHVISYGWAKASLLVERRPTLGSDSDPDSDVDPYLFFFIIIYLFLTKLLVNFARCICFPRRFGPTSATFRFDCPFAVSTEISFSFLFIFAFFLFFPENFWNIFF